jgi:hypothetical protein
MVALQKPGNGPKFPKNVRAIRLLPSRANVLRKLFYKLSKHIGGRNLHNASRFSFRARHSTTLQCMRLADHVTIKFNNEMSTAAVFFFSLISHFICNLYQYIRQIYGKGVKDKNVNSKCTHRQMTRLTYKGQTRPLIREGASQRQDNKFQTETLEKEAISGPTSTTWARRQGVLTDCQR